MKKDVTSTFLTILVLTCLGSLPGEAITCSEMQNKLMPCAGYLTGDTDPTDACCSSVKSLASNLQTQQDRQTACNCIKSAANSYGIQPNTAYNLMGKCNISVHVPVNVDCNQAP